MNLSHQQITSPPMFAFNFQSDMDHEFVKSRFHAQNNKNKNCPATIILRDIEFCTGFKVITDKINIMSLIP